MCVKTKRKSIKISEIFHLCNPLKSHLACVICSDKTIKWLGYIKYQNPDKGNVFWFIVSSIFYVFLVYVLGLVDKILFLGKNDRINGKCFKLHCTTLNWSINFFKCMSFHPYSSFLYLYTKTKHFRWLVLQLVCK